jgi:predicted transposase YdaD
MFNLQDIDLKQTRFYQQARSEGVQEGLRQAGVKAGEARLLLRLLERRFGPLPAAVGQRVAEADADTLLVYGERILDAESLDEVFAA